MQTSSRLFVGALALGGCASSPVFDMRMPDKSIDLLSSSIVYVGLEERANRDELKEFIGIDPVYTEWCAAFVNAVLEETNNESLNTIGYEYPLTAKGFLHWGKEVAVPVAGDIVIFPRGNAGWQGHVGIFVEHRTIDGKEYYMILGGNQDDKVSIKPYLAASRLGIRRME